MLSCMVQDDVSVVEGEDSEEANAATEYVSANAQANERS